MRPVLLLLALAPGLAACHGGLREGVFTKEGVRYEVGAKPAQWRQLELEDNDLAFVADSGHSIAVNSTCRNHGDPSLEVLTQHLIMGFTDRTRVAQEPGSIDGRASLGSHYTARLDGVPIELMLVVMKKDGCIYDFTYLSPQGRFEEKRPAFESLLSRFKTGTPP
ncbi:MAG: hypothetical protein ACYC8T_09515 [Myxococcaceae bacterium]